MTNSKEEFEVIEISKEVVVGVKPDEKHEWLIHSKDVAEGYGLSVSGLRSTKDRHKEEFDEGKHYVMMPSQIGTVGNLQHIGLRKV